MTEQSLICAYCGARAETEDHVISRCLLLPKQHDRPIKVPCCQSCNNLKSKEDEWLRLMLSISEQSGSGHDAVYARKKALRSLQKPQARGLARTFFRGMKQVEIRTPAGIYLSKRWGYSVELQRMCRAIEQIVRGLFYYETGRRLDPSYDVIAHTDETYEELDPDVRAMLDRDVLIPLAELPHKVVRPGAFHYRFQFASDCQDFSAWGLSFYNGHSFLVITLPKELVGPNDY